MTDCLSALSSMLDAIAVTLNIKWELGGNGTKTCWGEGRKKNE